MFSGLATFQSWPLRETLFWPIFYLPCVLALPYTVAYLYLTMPIMPCPAFCPRSDLFLLCRFWSVPLPWPVLHCITLPCSRSAPALQTLQFLAEATVRFCDWYITIQCDRVYTYRYIGTDILAIFWPILQR